MRTRSLKEGMRIDQNIIDRMGRVLIARKTPLDAYLIESLLKMGVPGVYIREGEEIEEEEKIEPQIQAKIEEIQIPDRAKVHLTQSVRKRVAEGVQFLYNDTENEDIIQSTESVTNDLMQAIAQNDAIAIDIGLLKVSDEYTFKHSVDVATMSMIIAKQYGLSRKDIFYLGVSGLLHDIGKSKIPNEILNKAGKLTDQEFAMMKNHSAFGYDILKEKKDVTNPILLGVLQHHEKCNGTGYPLGVTAEKIHLFPKIISVADIYDALVTERPYKKAFTPRTAVEMIMSMTEELDIPVMQSFLQSVILYSVGSTVQLSNGERAKVVENIPGYALRPKVVGLETGEVYDLATDMSCSNIIIE
ncbi:MAG: HD-GYP domain-containing protein [Lachnospiraceae bacterium]